MCDMGEHHFYISTARFLFQHAEYGIVIVRDPIKLSDAGKFGLRSVLLYGVTVARLPLRRITFNSRNQLTPLIDVLFKT